MQKEEQLTKADIKKINNKKLLGYVLPVFFTVFIGTFVSVSILNSNLEEKSLILLFAIFGIIIFSIYLSFSMNQKYVNDLSSEIKMIKVEKIEKKMPYKNYDPGSGSLYIPILGRLFPKLFDLSPKVYNLLILVINNHHYTVDKEIYEKVNNGDLVKMYYTKESDFLLGF